jgi:hypothetical protein
MYSSAQIARRRAVKYATLDALCDMAIIGKVGVRTLQGQEPLDLAARLAEFWLTVHEDAAALETLRTAKGCTSPPAGVETGGGVTTLLEFLEYFAVGAGRSSCGQGFAADCVLWATQLADRNPGNDRLRALWRTRKAAVDLARAAAEQEFRQFYLAPNQRQPRTAQEARFYLVWSRHLADMTREQYDDLLETLVEQFSADRLDRLTWDVAGSQQASQYAPA